MFCLHLNAFSICKLYIWSPVRFSSLWAVSLWSDSFPFITASPLHLHGFNPLPLWAVIQSVKQQLFVVKEATVANSFQLFYFCNPIWYPNDDSPFPYWVLEGSAAPLPWAQFPGAAMLWWISMLWVRWISEAGSCWLSKLILHFTAVRRWTRRAELLPFVVLFDCIW